MKTVAHYIPEKNYIGILNSLNQINPIILANLHDTIFDFTYVNKPDNMIIPLHEYTEEFHSFVQSKHKETNIIVYCGQLEHNELQNFFSSEDIKTIRHSKASNNKELCYEYLYDSTIFKNLNYKRIDKTLIILSQDNEKNKSILNEQLYPNSKLPICLINNPDFDHPQNIGTAYQIELAKLLNTYKNLIDIDQEFDLEAQACGIQNLRYDTGIESAITDQIIKPEVDNLEICESNYFVSKVLMPYMKG